MLVDLECRLLQLKHENGNLSVRVWSRTQLTITAHYSFTVFNRLAVHRNKNFGEMRNLVLILLDILLFGCRMPS